MHLYIDTTSPESIAIALYEGEKKIVARRIAAPRRQGEKLVPAIASLLKSRRLRPDMIRKIAVVNDGGSFTSLRIGVITANALAFALGIPVEAVSRTGKKDLKAVRKFGGHRLVVPRYDRPPEIGRSQKRLF